MTMITPSYLGETIEYSSLHACRSTLEDPTLQMEWCVDCHRQPERYVRPRDAVFSVSYVPPANQLELGRQLVVEYQIQKLTSCSTCHR